MTVAEAFIFCGMSEPHSRVEVICDCGTRKDVRLRSLLTGGSKSCGACADRFCEICGGQIRASNKLGICTRTEACNRERARRTMAKRLKKRPAEVRAYKASQYGKHKDRLAAGKGYVPGNVAIISMRANQIKNDATAEEHCRVAAWMDAQLEPGKDQG